MKCKNCGHKIVSAFELKEAGIKRLRKKYYHLYSEESDDSVFEIKCYDCNCVKPVPVECEQKK